MYPNNEKVTIHNSEKEVTITYDIESEKGLLDQKSTIAIRVKINREEQTQKAYMDIYGNHKDADGFVLQFSGTTSRLTAMGISIEYVSYYNKWTDIIVTFDGNGIGKVYINGERIPGETRTIRLYGNIYIGTGYFDNDRTMHGSIASFRCWDAELTQEEITKVDMTKKEINIQNDKIRKDIKFDSLESITEAGRLYRAKYEIQEEYK